MKIIDDEVLFKDFCILFNSKLSVLDLYNKFNQLNDKNYDCEKNDPLLLAVNDRSIFEFLNDINYSQFLIKVIRNIAIQDSCIDIFKSVFDENSLLTLIEEINKYKELVSIEIDCENKYYYINVAGFLADIILPLLSQLHLEILRNCHEFEGYVKAVQGDVKRLFLPKNIEKILFPSVEEDPILKFFLGARNNANYKGEAKRVLEKIYYL